MWCLFLPFILQVYAEGTHFKVPLIQYPVILDVRKTPRIITSITGTKDLQQVGSLIHSAVFCCSC